MNILLCNCMVEQSECLPRLRVSAETPTAETKVALWFSDKELHSYKTVHEHIVM